MFQSLQERWRHSHEQQELRLAVKQKFAERWPRLDFDVTPVIKVLRLGELVIPEDDAWFRVAYMNGPVKFERTRIRKEQGYAQDTLF